MRQNSLRTDLWAPSCRYIFVSSASYIHRHACSLALRFVFENALPEPDHLPTQRPLAGSTGPIPKLHITFTHNAMSFFFTQFLHLSPYILHCKNHRLIT